MEIYVSNVNQALHEAIHWLLVSGERETSRNGPVLAAHDPVTICYSEPTERVLFSEKRDANPFFHFMESLWMLQGRDDVGFVKFFASQMGNYSDDGVRFNGAYGKRWREFFGVDQLWEIAAQLRANPDSRRAVLTMWSGGHDLLLSSGAGASKDVPCNTQAYFDCRGGRLNMTVCNRSNDAIWGAFGANAVHFSVLLEVMAAMVGVPVGRYYQFSNNLHIYTEKFSDDQLREMAASAYREDMYLSGAVRPYAIVNGSVYDWFQDLSKFFEDPLEGNFSDSFFSDVAQPMYRSWYNRKNKLGNGVVEALNIAALDWRVACTTWIARRSAEKVVPIGESQTSAG